MIARLSLPLAFLLLAHPLAGVPPRRPAPAPAPREQIILRINQERNLAGAPPLAPVEALQQTAQVRAEAIAARGALPTEAESFRLFSQLQNQLARAGYMAQGWTESITVSAGDAQEVIDYWKGNATYTEAMRHEYQDVGVGVATFEGVPLYTFLFAWPKSEFFARQTEPLKDLPAVRDAMLATVNAKRQTAGLPALALDPRLSEAAQKHAEDMLARIYYSHQTPEGTMPWARVRALGYEPDLVGENIAAGHTVVAEVMDAWLHSPGHRHNILESRFTHLGVGVAVGTYEHRYQVIWVQDFARLRDPDLSTPTSTLPPEPSPPLAPGD
jgi:uncharacterized protein YkwD